jgi:hypothetical protein
VGVDRPPRRSLRAALTGAFPGLGSYRSTVKVGLVVEVVHCNPQA